MVLDRHLTSITAILLCCLGTTSVLAAATPDSSNPSQDPSTVAIISGPEDIGVGRTIILDASASHTSGERVEYKWSIDETKQVIGRTVEAVYTPEKTGVLTFRLQVKSTGLDGSKQQSEAVHSVAVFKRKIVLIADGSVSPEKLQAHTDTALQNGVYLRVVRPDPSTPTLRLEDATFTLLSQNKDILTNADVVVSWGDGISGLQALLRSTKADSEQLAQVHNLSIVLFTEQSINTIDRTVRGVHTALGPKETIITRKEAMHPLILAKDMSDFRTVIVARDIDNVAIVGTGIGLRPWNAISALVNYLLAHGVAYQTVILLLMLPVIATIFTFLKQVIGITTFGLYTPSIIALSFLSLGWWTGFLFLFFILIAGYATRSFMQRWRLLYIPKVAIILTVLSFTLLFLVAIGTSMGISFTRDTVFMLLILSTLVENFLTLKTEEGWMSAGIAVAETVIGALICITVAQWQSLQSIILAYPELILLTLLINIFLGRWTGLKLIEYIRFREVFRHLQEEE